MKLKTFGFAHDDLDRAHVPVTEECLHCGERMMEGDRGFLVWYGGNEHDKVSGYQPEHEECFIRGVVGSLAHQQRECSCYAPGSSCGDPDGMTVRQAARAAMDMARGIKK